MLATNTWCSYSPWWLALKTRENEISSGNAFKLSLDVFFFPLLIETQTVMKSPMVYLNLHFFSNVTELRFAVVGINCLGNQLLLLEVAVIEPTAMDVAPVNIQCLRMMCDVNCQRLSGHLILKANSQQC